MCAGRRHRSREGESETTGFYKESKRDELKLSREGFSRGSVLVVGKIAF